MEVYSKILQVLLLEVAKVCACCMLLKVSTILQLGNINKPTGYNATSSGLQDIPRKGLIYSGQASCTAHCHIKVLVLPTFGKFDPLDLCIGEAAVFIFAQRDVLTWLSLSMHGLHQLNLQTCLERA